MRQPYGLWSVLRRLFPGVRILCCTCHRTQALRRKIQEMGFQVPYTSDDTTYNFLKKVMALLFLPPNEILCAFERIRCTVTSQPLIQFPDYVADTCVYGSFCFPEDWSIYMKAVQTNDIEGWHNRINCKVNGKSQLPFYLLIGLLHQKARSTAIHIRLVSEKKLK